jgi:alginate O-acetyltransferase complex protein AlgI
MLFCSQQFLLFFAVVFAVYWSLPDQRLRVWFLLAASFYFYAKWNPWLAALIGASTAMDYALAHGMEATASPRRRKLLLAVSLTANLGLLGYFKYANFFLESLYQACGWPLPCENGQRVPLLAVILPVGISFYTFEAINYTVDVYRGRVRAERSLPNFMLFITFFPHLVAGPIVRARDFLPQIRRRKRWDWARLHLGAQLFLRGLFKKLAIADRMPLWTDDVFANPQLHNTGAAWLAVLAYALQIYCDFSGYSDMALGCAHVLGYKLAVNFELPYLSANVAEFWRRWHVSLSSWLRDYLFIPLGGSRGSRRRTNRNLLITMTLGGLWHGASWTFVAWGVLHGLLLIAHRAFRDWCAPRPRLACWLQSQSGTALRIGTTFLTVSLCWVFFRATAFGKAAELLKRLVVPHSGLGSGQQNLALLLIAAAFFLGQVLARRGAWKQLVDRLSGPVLGTGYAAALTLTLLLAPNGGQAFIYFQF